MTEKFVLSDHNIPDGILHDQDLYEIKLENDELTLSFEAHYYPQDYTDTSFAEKYKNFTKCHIKCILDEEDADSCDVELTSSMNKKNIYKTKVMALSEFVEIANQELEKRKKKGYWLWEYTDTSVAANIRTASIRLCMWMKYRGTVYSGCTLNLYTNEVEFIWE